MSTTEPNDLKFTTAGDYMKQQSEDYYINEAGLKIDARTGELYQAIEPTQTHCSPP